MKLRTVCSVVVLLACGSKESNPEKGSLSRLSQQLAASEDRMLASKRARTARGVLSFTKYLSADGHIYQVIQDE
jgi:hypothetical protein